MVNRLFVNIQHRTNLNHAGAVKFCYRLKAADSSLENQRHQKGLHRIVVMMPQRQLVISSVKQRLIQRAAAHFGAHGAGILFLAVVKNNWRNLRLYNGIGNLQLLAQLRDGAVIHTQTHVNGNSPQLEELIIASQPCQQGQQHQGIFAAGNTDRNFVPLFNHAVVLHTLADHAHKLLHCILPPKNDKSRKLEFKSIQEYLKENQSLSCISQNSRNNLLTFQSGYVINFKCSQAIVLQMPEKVKIFYLIGGTHMSTTLAKKETLERKWYVIDAAGKPLGRTAVIAANLLRGKHKVDFTPMLTAATTSSSSTPIRLF